jgi:hypothetical protein
VKIVIEDHHAYVVKFGERLQLVTLPDPMSVA